MNKIISSSKENCCGCNACAEICTKKCIEMTSDSEGFWYPNVDMSKCIDCHMCEKVCPVINVPMVPDKSPKAFAAYAIEERIRMDSSSGGIFSLLAADIIRIGGVVFGAAFDDKFNLSHIMVSSEDELKKLRGSKYLQSSTFDTYFDVKNLLKNRKTVLYVGTGCQIAGLKNYLRQQYENLYTVDILCHGVASPKVWKKYLSWQEKKTDTTTKQASFRSKHFGWKMFAVELIFNNSTKYLKKHRDDPYMQLFLNEICLRPSCHECMFKSLSRCSDITLGDFWGIKKIAPEMDDDKGTSIVLIHSEHGLNLYSSIQKVIKDKEVDADEALPERMDSRRKVPPHKKRKEFFSMLEDATIDNLVRLIEKPKYVKFSNNIKIKLKNIAKKILKIS